jgi:hypothetical protein
LTGTPPLDSPQDLNHVLQLTADDMNAWGVIAPDVLSAVVRRTQGGVNLPPPMVHQHVVSLTPQER